MSATREELIDFLKEAEQRGDMTAANKTLDKLEALGPVQQLPEASALPDEVQPEELPVRPVTAGDKYRELRDKVVSGVAGVADVAGTMITGAIAEPVAGLAGLADNYRLAPAPPLNERLEIINKGAPIIQPSTVGDRVQTVDATREALTLAPSTPEGTTALNVVAEFIKPGTEAWSALERHLGDTAYDVTESPAFATIMKSLPTALLELLGIGLGKGVGTSLANRPVKKMEKSIDSALEGAAPNKELLKSESTLHFTELDNLEVTVKPEVYTELVDGIEGSLIKGGMDARVTPEVAGALEAMKDTLESGKPITLSEIEVLREIANNAINPMDKNKARLGMVIIDGIDDFLESVSPEQLNFAGDIQPGKIGAKYRLAREQWGQFRRAEMLDKAVAKATDQASGFENGIRIQFRQILGNEKKAKFFTKSEKAAMQQVVNGDFKGNLFKTLGKAGIDFGGGNTGGLAMVIGGGAWYASGDPLTALAVIGGSSIAKELSKRLTVRAAKFANEVVRAGKDARKITEAYIRNTPPGKRSADELSLLLLDRDIDLSPLKKYRMEAEAAKLASEKRGMLAGALMPNTVNNVENSQNSEIR